MAFAPLSERGFAHPLAAAVEFTPQKPIVPIPGDSFRFRHERRGVGLRTHRYGQDAYKDYEMEAFDQKLERLVEKIQLGLETEHIIFDPLLTDAIFPKEDFVGIRRPDFVIFKVLENGKAELTELVEVKTADEFMNEVRTKVDESAGFPRFLEYIRESDYLRKRVKPRLGSIYLPEVSLPQELEGVRFRFISPNSQESKTTFQRWRTPHEVVEMPFDIARALNKPPARAA
jgi:hypothetical protein